jgi:hypothetical protein
MLPCDITLRRAISAYPNFLSDAAGISMPFVSLMLFPFMVLAAAGLAVSLIAHVMAIAGMAFADGRLAMLLYAGIVLVWIPTVLILTRTARNASGRDFWKIALSGCPGWMKRTLYIVFGYAVLNFILFMATSANVRHPIGDAPLSVVRGFSAYWLAFYGPAFCVLHSALHAPDSFRQRKCAFGHSVNASARFCPECGSPIIGTTSHG